MKGRPTKLVSSALLVVLFGFCSQTFAYDGGLFPYRGIFSDASLNGTYYIPCACEGTDIRTAGIGKVHFDGRGSVTLTQYAVYIDNTADGIAQVVDMPLPTSWAAGRWGWTQHCVGGEIRSHHNRWGRKRWVRRLLASSAGGR